VFFITPLKGAATSVYLADEPVEKLKPYNGQYFNKKKPAATNNKDISETNANALWDKSMEVLKIYL
jgi:hypothetical protein